jgi:hypothetical protein
MVYLLPGTLRPSWNDPKIIGTTHIFKSISDRLAACKILFVFHMDTRCSCKTVGMNTGHGSERAKILTVEEIRSFAQLE